VLGAAVPATVTLGRHDPSAAGSEVPAAIVDPQAAATGGAAAPNEESGFGNGVDGLTPVTPGTDGTTPAASSAPDLATGSGGYAAPPDKSAVVAAPEPGAAAAQYVPGSPPAG
jgi:hypothetical protein